MKFDFTSHWDRLGKDASALDAVGTDLMEGIPTEPKEGFDFIPMWVADMNFATAPSVTDAIRERLEHPIFGYFSPREEYFESIVRWQTERNGMEDLKAEYIGYENGVHGGITSAVEVLSRPGDHILVHAPTYVGFQMDVEGLGRTSVFSELIKDEEGIYRMDYEDMDAKLKEYNIHLAIFCSPHNPSGRVWERWELEKAMEVFEANECYVISDEIWADITYSGHQHIPLLMVNDWARDHVVSFYAPSKTFNLGGLIGSYHIIYNNYLRDRITNYGLATHYNSLSVPAMYALIGGYSAEGEEWVGELRETLENNLRYAVDYIKEHFPGVEVTMPQGTYMLFLDVGKHLESTDQTLDELIQSGWDVGVGWQDGRRFNGPTHIRMNLALPMDRVQEAFKRLDEHVFNS